MHHGETLVLCCGDQAQVSAIGALLNLLGPALERGTDAPAKKKALGRLLSCTLAVSMFEQSLLKACKQTALEDEGAHALICS